MNGENKNPYAAGSQALGYIYQSRLAMLSLFRSPEEIEVYIERDDDIEFLGAEHKKTLASLKHKKVGDRLTDLSTDFWKSIKIWMDRFERDGRSKCNHSYVLFTTASVAAKSFLLFFLNKELDNEQVVEIDSSILKTLEASETALSKQLLAKLQELEPQDRQNFWSRIIIFDNHVRIENIPEIIKSQHMRTVRSQHRTPIYERLEGWWDNQVILMLTSKRKNALTGHEVSDKLASIADEFKVDNLPIDFRDSQPANDTEISDDNRLFVFQLKSINVSTQRIRKAITDYYRAFEQRSAWARENVLFEGEIEQYEALLVDEWERYKDILFDELGEDTSANLQISAGKELYKWAELNTGHLRIRERVTEPYVVRGSFHILANTKPDPRVYWHPRFLGRIREIFEESA